MELNSNVTIQLTNVENNETFEFSVIIVKGRVLGDLSNCVDDRIAVCEIDHLGNILKKYVFKFEDKKFSLLLRLKAGKNDFLFQYKTAKTRQTFNLVSSPVEFVVSPMLIICEGEEISGDVIENIKTKIYIGCNLIQTLIAEILYEYGFGRKTFALEKEDENRNGGCLTFHSKLNVNAASTMNSEELWEYFGREIMTSEHGFKHRKFLSFLSCGEGKISQNLAIGGGGLALCSVEYARTWPSCIDEINKYFNNEITRSISFTNNIKNLFSASLGAVCHELCHTFDLGHTTSGIMGEDFDRVGIVFSSQQCIWPSSTSKLRNLNCTRGKKDSLIVQEGTSRRKLRISYSINCDVSLRSTPMSSAFENYAPDMNRITCGEKTKSDHILPAVSLMSTGCASLLAYHKWINHSCSRIKNVNIEINGNSSLHYDTIRNIVTSTFGLILIQLRNQDGYVLKSWEFLERKTKTLFLVPICESRKADLIVIQDMKGNLLKKNIEHYLTDF